jgi:hypothetical protein
MSAEKPISPGTVALDPRADESQENLPRTEGVRPAPAPQPAPAAVVAEPATEPSDVEIIVPDPIEPVVIVDTTHEPTVTPDEEPVEQPEPTTADEKKPKAEG